MQFGFTTTTVRQIKDIEKIVLLAKDAGADCIEWGGDIHIKDIEAAKKAKQLCEKHNISIFSYASYYRAGDCNAEEWEKVCLIAAELEAKSVRVWLGRKDSEKTDEDTYNKILKDIKDMCRVAEKYSLIVCPECHDNTYNNNTDAFLRLQRDAGCENFRTYFQSRYKKLKYDLDRIERTLPFIEAVHISFSELRREQFPKYDPSYADTLISKLRQVNYDGTVLLEYTYIWGRYGIPSYVIRDLKKLKEKFTV